MIRGVWNFDQPRSFAVGSTLAASGGNQMRADAAFSELKIYRHALGDAQVQAEYRRFLPVDAVAERRFLRAGEPEQAVLDVWPGGQMLRPPVGSAVPTPVELPLRAGVNVLQLHARQTDLRLGEDDERLAAYGIALPVPVERLP